MELKEVNNMELKDSIEICVNSQLELNPDEPAPFTITKLSNRDGHIFCKFGIPNGVKSATVKKLLYDMTSLNIYDLSECENCRECRERFFSFNANLIVPDVDR